MQSRLTVLLPFRNAENTIAEALNSTLSQTFRDFDLLVIDDQSSDKTRDIIQTFSDPRIHLINNSDTGLVSSLNLGIDLANTDWIVRMDADDIMLPTRLEELKTMAETHPHLDLIASQVDMFPKEDLLSGYREYLRWQNQVVSPDQIANEIYVESPFAHPAVMFRKSSVIKVGGYRHGDFPEDYDLWLRMHLADMSMEKIPEVLLHWRDSPRRLSRTHSIYRREAFDALRAEHLANDARISKERPIAFWGAGRKTRKRCAHLLEKGFKPVAWIDIDPKKIGNSVQGVPVRAPGWLNTAQPKPFVLNYVTNHGARDEITASLESMGFLSGNDFLSVG